MSSALLTRGQGVPVAVLPDPVRPEVMAALRAAGVRPGPVREAEGLIWTGDQPEELDWALRQAPSVRWVQLASSGVEDYLPMMGGRVRWIRAAGVQAALVAEHALMLALTVLREGTASTRAGIWLPRTVVPLAGSDVLIVGGGAIARCLLDLLHPFRIRATVVRRSGGSVPGAFAVHPPDRLDEQLPAARVVFLAAPLTPQTAGLIDAVRLSAMRPDSCLVNVSRGGLVVTEDLVRALTEQWIAGAGLDVTEPEPLPREHPLWLLPNCLITAHCAGDQDNSLARFADLVRRNMRLLASGHEPIGLVNLEAGY
jgi:phosphoglycerate dehydrogenase-like enzyme